MAAILATVIAVVAVDAATPTPAAGNSNPAQVFLVKLAGILHLSPSQVQDDVKQAELQTIDQMVKDGRLTQAQADVLKQKINSGRFGAGFGFGRFGFGKRAFAPMLAMALRNAELDAAAKTLKTTTANLMADLRSGKTLASLEQAAGVSDSTLRSALHDAAKTVLDKAVKAKTITQAQEDMILQRIGNGGFLNLRGFKRGARGWSGRSPAVPGATGTEFSF